VIFIEHKPTALQALQAGRVKALTLEGTGTYVCGLRVLWSALCTHTVVTCRVQGSAISAQHAAGIAAACAHLQRLTLVGLSNCPPAFSSGLAACTELTHLTLDRVQLGTDPAAAPALCQLLTNLPALQELTFSRMRLAAHFAASPAVLQRITSLSACHCNSTEGWVQLLEGRPAFFQRLHTLELETCGDVSAATLRALGSCALLRKLTVGRLQPEQGEDALDRPLPALESLAIAGMFPLQSALRMRWLAQVGIGHLSLLPALSKRLARQPACSEQAVVGVASQHVWPCCCAGATPAAAALEAAVRG
jgi:hypothetical protein